MSTHRDDDDKVIRMPGTEDLANRPVPASTVELLLYEMAELREEVVLVSKALNKLIRILKDNA